MNRRFEYVMFDGFIDNKNYEKEYISPHEVANILNEQHETIEQLKQQNQEYQAILQDMGILLTDNEVINLRNEIADKLLKPMFKSNGFDVDIDTADGFTIIPKGDVE